MRHKHSTTTLLVVLLFAALPSYSQYFNTLHNVDSNYEWGWNILLRSDGTYMVNGWAIDMALHQPKLFNINISSDGQHILSKHELVVPATSYGLGDPGQMRRLPGGSYIAPATVQRSSSSYLTSRGGILKYNASGDTVFVKLYTDTFTYFDVMSCSAIMPDGSFLVGGEHGTNTPSMNPAMVMRTDSNGDTIWTHTYQKLSAQYAAIRTLVPLNDGRFVAGAHSTYTYFTGGNAFYHHTPWFLLLDSMGNIIRDTLYGTKYNGGGYIYPDMNGGYIHFGWIDTVAVPAFPNDLSNFPFYIARLDTNFRMEWITRFSFADCNSRRSACQIKQLHDSTYLIIGDDYCNGCLCAPAYSGWAAKISKTGEILWNRNYWTDTTNVAYLRDMVELPDGNMVFVGSAFNDSLPSWHGGRDVWIFGTDSNGCVIPGCSSITAVPEAPPPPATTLSLYPNPTGGSFTVLAGNEGELKICDIMGRQLAGYKIQAGKTEIYLPKGVAAGIYIGLYRPDGGGQTKEVKIMYQP